MDEPTQQKFTDWFSSLNNDQAPSADSDQNKPMVINHVENFQDQPPIPHPTIEARAPRERSGFIRWIQHFQNKPRVPNELIEARLPEPDESTDNPPTITSNPNIADRSSQSTFTITNKDGEPIAGLRLKKLKSEPAPIPPLQAFLKPNGHPKLPMDALTTKHPTLPPLHKVWPTKTFPNTRHQKTIDHRSDWALVHVSKKTPPPLQEILKQNVFHATAHPMHAAHSLAKHDTRREPDPLRLPEIQRSGVMEINKGINANGSGEIAFGHDLQRRRHRHPKAVPIDRVPLIISREGVKPGIVQQMDAWHNKQLVEHPIVELKERNPNDETVAIVRPKPEKSRAAKVEQSLYPHPPKNRESFLLPASRVSPFAGLHKKPAPWQHLEVPISLPIVAATVQHPEQPEALQHAETVHAKAPHRLTEEQLAARAENVAFKNKSFTEHLKKTRGGNQKPNEEAEHNKRPKNRVQVWQKKKKNQRDGRRGLMDNKTPDNVPAFDPVTRGYALSSNPPGPEAFTYHSANKAGGNPLISKYEEQQLNGNPLITMYAGQSPALALRYSNRYLEHPNAMIIIAWVAERAPEQALEFAHHFVAMEGAGDVIAKAAERCPALALRYANHYINHPDAMNIIALAAQKAPAEAFKYAHHFSHRKEAENILIDAAKEVPLAAVHYAHRYLDRPMAGYILGVAEIESAARAAKITRSLEDQGNPGHKHRGFEYVYPIPHISQRENAEQEVQKSSSKPKVPHDNRTMWYFNNHRSDWEKYIESRTQKSSYVSNAPNPERKDFQRKLKKERQRSYLIDYEGPNGQVLYKRVIVEPGEAPLTLEKISELKKQWADTAKNAEKEWVDLAKKREASNAQPPLSSRF